MALAAATGCVSRGPLVAPGLEARAPRQVELTQTPFFPQREYQCGPAALATVLAASGVNVTPDELTPRIYIPQRHGSLQPEMIAATREYDRLAVALEPNVEALLQEVAAGNPVLVLQNLGVRAVPLWHYAVVVGFDAARDSLVLRSGEDARERTSARRFIYSWDLARNWALVVVRPDNIPATATAASFAAAAAGLEAAHRYDAALAAYRAAHQRWPEDTTALLGIGNVQYATGHLLDAEQAYRQVLALSEHDAVARNNLAQVLLERGDAQSALVEVLRARSELADQRLAPMLAATEAEVRSALATPALARPNEHAGNN